MAMVSKADSDALVMLKCAPIRRSMVRPCMPSQPSTLRLLGPCRWTGQIGMGHLVVAMRDPEKESASDA